MLRLGCVILTIWGGVHLIVSALSLVVSALGQYAPFLKMVFTDQEIGAYDQKMLIATKSLAIMHNSGATIFGALMLVLTWFGINQSHRWAFWTLLAVGAFAHAMWFLADSFVGNKTLVVNVILTSAFAVGAILCGYGLYGR